MTDNVVPAPRPSLYERVTGWAEFLGSIKEIVAIIFAAIACVIVAFNYFVTRAELEAIHCQLRTFLQIQSHDISHIRLIGQMEKMDIEIVALKRLPSRTDYEDRKLLQLETDRTTFNNDGNASKRHSKELADKLQAGECPLKSKQ